MKQEIIDKVEKIIIENSPIGEEVRNNTKDKEFRECSLINELSYDSLSFIRMISDVEEELDIIFDDEILLSSTTFTVSTILDAVDKLLA